MSKLLINEAPLQVLPTLAKWVGLNEAIVLQQIHYWLENPKVGTVYQGQKWVRNTIEEWQRDNFPFWDNGVIKRAIANLESDGLIVASRKPNQKNYDRTKWYRINYAALNQLAGPVERLTKKAEKRRSARSKSRTVQNVPYGKATVQNVPMRKVQNVPNGMVQNVPTNTRDYSETTAERGTAPAKIKLMPIPEAIIEICKINVALMMNGLAHEVQEVARLLDKAGVTPAQVRAFGEWWYKNDWRGRKGEAPKPRQICECWGQYEQGNGSTIQLTPEQRATFEALR